MRAEKREARTVSDAVEVHVSVMARGGAGASASLGGAFYGRERFSPSLILSQVILIQVAFYTADAVVLLVLDYILGVPAFLSRGQNGMLLYDQMLRHSTLSTHTSAGLIALSAYSFAAVVCGPLAFVAIVGRSKRALDFSITLSIAHLVCCWMYGGFPTSPLWWCLVVFAGVIMTFVCEVLTRRIELRDIAVPRSDIENQTDDDEDAIQPA